MKSSTVYKLNGKQVKHTTFTKISEIRDSFWKEHPQFKSNYKKSYRDKDYKGDVRVAFYDYVWALVKKSKISQSLADRAKL